MQQQQCDETGQQQFIIKQDDNGETDVNQPLAITTDSDSQDGQITAEVVQADLPSPGNFSFLLNRQESSFNILVFFFQ